MGIYRCFFSGGKVPLYIRFQLGNSFGNTYIGDFFLKSSGMQKKSTRLKWLISLLNPFKKCKKNNRAKGVALKSPDIKIIMYVCIPLNKVFGFQGS